jgi:hypothetical protein
MTTTWYGATLLVGSNFAYLFPAYYSWRIGASFQIAQFLSTFAASMLYHFCDSQVFCLGIPLFKWRMFDYVFAFGQMPSLFFAILSTGMSAYMALTLTATQLARDRMWSNFLWLFMQFVVTGTAILSDLGFSASLAPILTGALAIALYVVFVSKGEHSFLDSVDWRFLGPGLLSLAIGLFLFFSDSFIPYFFSHSLWHLFSGLGLQLVLAGVTAPVADIRKALHEEGFWLL